MHHEHDGTQRDRRISSASRIPRGIGFLVGLPLRQEGQQGLVEGDISPLVSLGRSLGSQPAYLSQAARDRKYPPLPVDVGPPQGT